MTPLEREIRSIIASEGPITVERYMQLALTHPLHGYYATRDPLGAAGDFTTAPEISQMFGEMIGIWAAEVWTSMGAPSEVALVELGPGRGTLMMDLLRAAQVVPDFSDALEVRLIESSPILTQVQKQTLARAKARIAWSTSFDTARRGPAIIVANEFFDALPVRHYVNTARGWFERHVGLGSDDALAFGLSNVAETSIPAHPAPGAVLEVGVAAHLLMHSIAERIVADGGALLAVDYGHSKTGVGETLQAVKAHAPVHPLHAPGEVDLTAHVDFAALARAGQAAGATVYGPVTQGAFLEALGIFQRADGLKSHATPTQAEEIDAALLRLVGEAEGNMGEHFKVLAIVDPRLPPPPGFGAEDAPDG